MLPATDDQIAKWKRKYGEDIINHFIKVRSGELTIQELADQMKVTKECARQYFHRFYSEADLIGTRFYKTLTRKKQRADSVGNAVFEKLTSSRLHKIEEELHQIKELLVKLNSKTTFGQREDAVGIVKNEKLTSSRLPFKKERFGYSLEQEEYSKVVMYDPDGEPI